MTITTHELTLSGVGLTVTEQGAGQPVLLLHGGGGPQTVAGFAGLLADREAVRVITPIHPGFGGTPRPEALSTIAELAALYDELLTALDLREVIVIGNSVGGWIAAELAVRGSDRIAGQVLVDAVGIEVPGHSVLDIFPLAPDQLSRFSFHDPAAFRIDPASLTEDQRRIAAANRDVLRIYAGGASMTDPALAVRLSSVDLPTLVVWGESDGVVDPDFGRAYAAAIPGARFVLLPATGHLPQLETPGQLLQAVHDFRAALAGSPAQR